MSAMSTQRGRPLPLSVRLRSIVFDLGIAGPQYAALAATIYEATLMAEQVEREAREIADNRTLAAIARACPDCED